MKKLLPILFLSIYLVSVTELHELFKLPQLVEHFMEHKSEDSKTTFLDFLAMHYSDSDHANQYNPEDTQLPFKSHHDCGNLVSIGFVAFNNFYLFVKPIPIESKVHKTHSIDFISSAYLSSIWQPPKSC